MQAATADAVESLGFVPYTDLLELDPRAKHRRQLAHERAKVDSRLGGKVQNTQGYEIFKTFQLGTMQLAAGDQSLRVEAITKGGTEAMRLERVRLIPQ